MLNIGDDAKKDLEDGVVTLGITLTDYFYLNATQVYLSAVCGISPPRTLLKTLFLRDS